MAPVSVIRRGSTWRRGYLQSSTLNAIWDSINSIDTFQVGGDVIVWTAFKSGLYTLKSAYNHLRGTGDTENWTHLVWFKGAIPRFSFITWLLLRGRLPTLDRLFQWGVVRNPTCYICGQVLETSQHLFFECPYSSEVWSSILAKCLLAHIPAGWDSEQEWLETALAGGSAISTTRRLALTATVYYIWAERNSRAHNATIKSPKMIISHIISAIRCRLIYLFPQVQDCADNKAIFDSWNVPYNGKQEAPIWAVWSKPASPYIAVNTDASIREDRAGQGWILRDHQGIPIVAAVSRTQPATESILYYELQAIYKGLVSTQNLSYLHVILQSDSKTAIDILLGKAKPPWKCWIIHSSIIAIIDSFHDIVFTFVYREANQPADFLSHYGNTPEVQTLWPADFPMELQALVTRDRDQIPYLR